jgi:hypothetical protein
MKILLGTHRFQRAVSAKDLLIGIRRPPTWKGLVPVNAPFAETARWRRCVPSDFPGRMIVDKIKQSEIHLPFPDHACGLRIG